MRCFCRLLGLAGPVWLLLAAAAGAGFLAVAAGAGMLATAAYLIAMAALSPPLAALSVSIAGVRFFTLLRAGTRYLERYLAHDAILRLLSDLRVRLYRALERLATARFDAIGDADLFARLVADIDRLQFFYLRVVLPLLVAVMATVGLGCFLGVFAWHLIYPAVAGFLVAGGVLPLVFYRVGAGLGRVLATAGAEHSTAVIDCLRGWRELAAAGKLSQQAERVVQADHRLAQAQKGAAGLTGLADAASGLVVNLTVLAVFLAAAEMVRSDQLPGVYLGALTLAVQGAAEAMLPLTAIFRHWGESMSSAERVFSLLIYGPVLEKANREEVPVAYDIELRDVRFRYQPEGPWVLDGLSLSLAAGSRVGVVGASGAGKSTLAKLLLRLYDPEDGCVLLGGRDIREYRSEAVWASMGVVEQHNHLFNASVADNIRLAKPSAGENEVVAAARAAGLGKIIDEWPQGLASSVGENGHCLSGGERQRVAMARVLLKKPQVFILDEPTAGLDPVSAQTLLDSLLAGADGRTTLSITHRLAGLAVMDDIIVLDQGRVAERGSFDELLARQGIFYEMWRLEQDLF
ncbi:thiol reductant ABC exporter subunit CydC [Anaeroselena agilis]|uniref:Thiol reductant ABC exporter subunit CydC n=1 Tax=Anaeroselena agilis TaxID=3063788 RepID=A0ABU3NUI3_9FIRM|nr:thiol reductant ABC exporter subunit CydC [Selenomonadales bacterium 4137-cl]